MIEVPPPARDADMLQQFARIGIGPGLDVEAQDESTKRGLARAAVDGKKIIAEAFTDGYLQKVVNGWNYPPPATGRPSPSSDWIFRDMQMLAGFVANDPSRRHISTFPSTATASLYAEEPLRHPFRQGRRAEGQSVLVGDDVQSQVQSRRQSDRPLFARRPFGMKPDADGGLTIYVAEGLAGTGQGKQLAARPRGQFFLILRTYLPADDIVNQTWQPPKISRVGR